MNKEIFKLLLKISCNFFEISYYRTICWFTGGHQWSDDENKCELWRRNSGWESIGGFPECEARKCIKCGKYEER